MFGKKPQGTSWWSFKSTMGTFLAASAAIFPFIVGDSKPTEYAKRDEFGRPSICFGHTRGVVMTDMATPAQCQKYLEEDMTYAVATVIKYTPGITENHNAFRAASDFVLTVEDGQYETSPMAKHFAKKNWVEGCNAFVGYKTQVRFVRNKKRYKCVKLADGTWSCDIPELYRRREQEKKICLGKT